MAHQSGGLTTGRSQRLPGSEAAGVGGGDEGLGFIALWRFLKAALSEPRRSGACFGAAVGVDGVDLVDGMDLVDC